MPHRSSLLAMLLCASPLHAAEFQPIRGIRVDSVGAMTFSDVRMSIVHFGDKKHTILMDWGELPHLVRRGRATITMDLGDTRTAKAWAIDMSGGRMRETSLGRDDEGRFVLDAQTAQPWGGCLAYEVVRD